MSKYDIKYDAYSDVSHLVSYHMNDDGTELISFSVSPIVEKNLCKGTQDIQKYCTYTPLNPVLSGSAIFDVKTIILKNILTSKDKERPPPRERGSGGISCVLNSLL